MLPYKTVSFTSFNNLISNFLPLPARLETAPFFQNRYSHGAHFFAQQILSTKWSKTKAVTTCQSKQLAHFPKPQYIHRDRSMTISKNIPTPFLLFSLNKWCIKIKTYSYSPYHKLHDMHISPRSWHSNIGENLYLENRLRKHLNIFLH